MKKLVLLLPAVVAILLVLAVGRALTLDSPQAAFLPEGPLALPVVDEAGAAARLAGAIRYATVSNLPPQPIDTAAFLGLHGYLEEAYPLVHANLGRETVNGLSLLYTWEGTDPARDPVVLMGHTDVVPVIPGTEEDWTHPAYDGSVRDGFVWGRGAVDDKSSVVAILEAVEALLAEGYRPSRTFYLAFGHDEEIGGPRGAAALADTIARRSSQLAFVVDEGGAIVRGMLPGVEGPAAIVGVAEKGFLSVRLRISGQGGHSSVPPATTTVGILAEAIRRLEENPFPTALDGPTRAMLETIAPEASLGMRTVLGNLWLFGPLVKRQMAATPEGSAMLRTTTAATMFNAGVKDNVLPITAAAVVNFRIRPGETVQSTLERIQQVVDDPRIQVEVAYDGAAQDPSPVSDPTGAAYRVLARSIHETLGNGGDAATPGEPPLVVIPYLVVGGTDAKYYSGRSRNVFRFLPVDFGDAGLGAIHGTDERIAVSDFADAIRFFQRLIRNAETLAD
ncbi:MAG TPA: M20 family peptidase [Longimicrobiales bacterium]|nr:M20 family peptidase [Longimicrobiales bacterium]